MDMESSNSFVECSVSEMEEEDMEALSGSEAGQEILTHRDLDSLLYFSKYSSETRETIGTFVTQVSMGVVTLEAGYEKACRDPDVQNLSMPSDVLFHHHKQQYRNMARFVRYVMDSPDFIERLMTDDSDSGESLEYVHEFKQFLREMTHHYREKRHHCLAERFVPLISLPTWAQGSDANSPSWKRLQLFLKQERDDYAEINLIVQSASRLYRHCLATCKGIETFANFPDPDDLALFRSEHLTATLVCKRLILELTSYVSYQTIISGEWKKLPQNDRLQSMNFIGIDDHPLEDYSVSMSQIYGAILDRCKTEGLCMMTMDPHMVKADGIDVLKKMSTLKGIYSWKAIDKGDLTALGNWMCAFLNSRAFKVEDQVIPESVCNLQKRSSFMDLFYEGCNPDHNSLMFNKVVVDGNADSDDKAAKIIMKVKQNDSRAKFVKPARMLNFSDAVVSAVPWQYQGFQRGNEPPEDLLNQEFKGFFANKGPLYAWDKIVYMVDPSFLYDKCDKETIRMTISGQHIQIPVPHTNKEQWQRDCSLADFVTEVKIDDDDYDMEPFKAKRLGIPCMNGRYTSIQLAGYVSRTVACAAVASLIDEMPNSGPSREDARNDVFEALIRPPFVSNLHYMQHLSVNIATKSTEAMAAALISVLTSVLTAPFCHPDVTSVDYHNDHFSNFLWQSFSLIHNPQAHDKIELKVLKNNNFSTPGQVWTRAMQKWNAPTFLSSAARDVFHFDFSDLLPGTASILCMSYLRVRALQKMYLEGIIPTEEFNLGVLDLMPMFVLPKDLIASACNECDNHFPCDPGSGYVTIWQWAQENQSDDVLLGVEFVYALTVNGQTLGSEGEMLACVGTIDESSVTEFHSVELDESLRGDPDVINTNAYMTQKYWHGRSQYGPQFIHGIDSVEISCRNLTTIVTIERNGEFSEHVFRLGATQSECIDKNMVLENGSKYFKGKAASVLNLSVAEKMMVVAFEHRWYMLKGRFPRGFYGRRGQTIVFDPALERERLIDIATDRDVDISPARLTQEERQGLFSTTVDFDNRQSHRNDIRMFESRYVMENKGFAVGFPMKSSSGLMHAFFRFPLGKRCRLCGALDGLFMSGVCRKCDPFQDEEESKCTTTPWISASPICGRKVDEVNNLYPHKAYPTRLFGYMLDTTRCIGIATHGTEHRQWVRNWSVDSAGVDKAFPSSVFSKDGVPMKSFCRSSDNDGDENHLDETIDGSEYLFNPRIDANPENLGSNLFKDGVLLGEHFDQNFVGMLPLTYGKFGPKQSWPGWQAMRNDAVEQVVRVQCRQAMAEFPLVVAELMTFIGRMHFGTRNTDKWDRILFMHGHGGTGKSDLIKNQESMYPSAFKLTFGATSERFGPGNIYQKWVLYQQEMPTKKTEQLPLNIYKSIASGDGFDADRKNKDSSMIHPDAPLWIACNEIGHFATRDSGIVRRVMPFFMREKVTPRDKQNCPYMGNLVSSVHGVTFMTSVMAYTQSVFMMMGEDPTLGMGNNWNGTYVSEPVVTNFTKASIAEFQRLSEDDAGKWFEDMRAESESCEQGWYHGIAEKYDSAAMDPFDELAWYGSGNQFAVETHQIHEQRKANKNAFYKASRCRSLWGFILRPFWDASYYLERLRDKSTTREPSSTGQAPPAPVYENSEDEEDAQKGFTAFRDRSMTTSILSEDEMDEGDTDDEEYNMDPRTNNEWKRCLRFVTEQAIQEFDERFWSQDRSTESIIWRCIKNVISEVSCEQAVIASITSYFTPNRNEENEVIWQDPCGLIQAIAEYKFAPQDKTNIVNWARALKTQTSIGGRDMFFAYFVQAETNLVWTKWYRFLKTVFLNDQDVRRFHDKLLVDRDDEHDRKSFQFDKSIRDNKRKLINEIEKCQHIPSPDTHVKIHGREDSQLAMIFTDYVICDGHPEEKQSNRIIERYALDI